MTTFPRNFPDSIAAVIFDFDETMIDLEEQHTYADAELCRQMGNDHSQMPESFRFSILPCSIRSWSPENGFPSAFRRPPSASTRMQSSASSASIDDRPDEEDRGPEQHETEQHGGERFETPDLFLARGAECEK